MENQFEIHGDSFAKELVKAFVLSAAATAGMVTGFMVAAVIGSRLNKKQETK